MLITGGAGFIGRHVVNKLAYHKVQIAIIDDLSNSYADFTTGSQDKIVFYKQDIRNKRAVLEIFRNEKPDTCIHLAARISVTDSITNPSDTVDVNVGGTLNMLEACSENKTENFIFASSAAVYGNSENLPLSEDQTLRPISPYGASKIAGEALVAAYRNSGKIENTTSLRFFNIYGEGQTPEYAGVITRFAERLSKKLPPVIYGSGDQTRDFISVTDVVNAIIIAATLDKNKKESSSHPVFNIGTGKPLTIKDLAQLMIMISKLELKPIYSEARIGDITHSYADMGRSKKHLAFVESEKIDSTISEMWNALVHDSAEEDVYVNNSSFRSIYSRLH